MCHDHPLWYHICPGHLDFHFHSGPETTLESMSIVTLKSALSRYAWQEVSHLTEQSKLMLFDDCIYVREFNLKSRYKILSWSYCIAVISTFYYQTTSQSLTVISDYSNLWFIFSIFVGIFLQYTKPLVWCHILSVWSLCLADNSYLICRTRFFTLVLLCSFCCICIL